MYSCAAGEATRSREKEYGKAAGPGIDKARGRRNQNRAPLFIFLCKDEMRWNVQAYASCKE